MAVRDFELPMMNASGRSAFSAGDKNPDWKPLLSGFDAKVEQATSSLVGSSTHVRMNERMARAICGQSVLLVQPAFSNQPFRSPVIAGATWVQAPRLRLASESFQGRSFSKIMSVSSTPASAWAHSSLYEVWAAILVWAYMARWLRPSSLFR